MIEYRHTRHYNTIDEFYRLHDGPKPFEYWHAGHQSDKWSYVTWTHDRDLSNRVPDSAVLLAGGPINA